MQRNFCYSVLSFAEIEIEACIGGSLFEEREGIYNYDIGVEFICPDDITLQAGPNGKATFNKNDYEFQLDCLGSGNGGISYLGPRDGDELLPGEYLYEI